MDKCKFYVWRNRIILPDNLANPEEYCYEPFCEYKFKKGSLTRADMRRAEEWIKSDQFYSDGDPVNDEYEGWYWGIGF